MRRRKQSGLTLVELIVAFTIMLILTSMAVPLARAKVRAQRERALRYALDDMRLAIDKYKDYCDMACSARSSRAPTAGRRRSSRWSRESKLAAPPTTRRSNCCAAFRATRSPTQTSGHAQRSGRSHGEQLGGQNVFDVYSKTDQKAPDGTAYSEW